MIAKEELWADFFSVCIKVRANFLKLEISFKPVCLHLWVVSALRGQALSSESRAVDRSIDFPLAFIFQGRFPSKLFVLPTLLQCLLPREPNWYAVSSHRHQNTAFFFLWEHPTGIHSHTLTSPTHAQMHPTCPDVLNPSLGSSWNFPWMKNAQYSFAYLKWLC